MAPFIKIGGRKDRAGLSNLYRGRNVGESRRPDWHLTVFLPTADASTQRKQDWAPQVLTVQR